MLTSEQLAKDGGPAFPCSNDAGKEYWYIMRGMTQREYFAAKALDG